MTYSINDKYESSDIKDALIEIIGKNKAKEYAIVVQDKKGYHDSCPYGFDLTIDIKNRIVLLERYDNYKESYQTIYDEIKEVFDGSTEYVKEPNLKRKLSKILKGHFTKKTIKIWE